MGFSTLFASSLLGQKVLRSLEDAYPLLYLSSIVTVSHLTNICCALILHKALAVPVKGHRDAYDHVMRPCPQKETILVVTFGD